MTVEEKYKIALQMLAEWCVAIQLNGTMWDDWDEYYYKDVTERPGPLSQDLDEEICEARKIMDWENSN